MSKPLQRNSPSRVRLRFARQSKRTQLQLSIQSLFILTTLVAMVVYVLKWLYPSHLPLMPMMALIPPLIATFLLLSATKNEIWKGVLIGALVGICYFVCLDET